MMFEEVVRRGGKILRTNSPLILSSATGLGVLTTAYLSARAGYAAAEIINAAEEEDGHALDPRTRFKHRARLTWRVYIPAGIASGASIAFVIGSARVNGRRIAAANTAVSLTAAAFDQYRGKVAETFGVGKESKLRDELAAERVASNPPPVGLVIGAGKVQCCELFTGRYFECDMETLRRAQNEVNARLVREMYCQLSEFYYEVGLPFTSQSSDIGWEAGKPLELRFSSVLHEGKPYLTFEYNYTKIL